MGKEMEDRLRRKKEEEDKELDEYSRSKIDRRSEGKEELTFEEWKKEKEDIKKAEEKELKKKEEEKKAREKEEKEKARANAAPTDDSLYKPSSNTKEKKDKVELDEEDERDLKGLRGYKKTSDGRTTSYFNNELDEHTKSLIGNIAPKRIDSKSS